MKKLMALTAAIGILAILLALMREMTGVHEVFGGVRGAGRYI